MEISAKQVKELREKTGVGMMDCKKALVETSGDFEKAVEFLRKKGLADAAKRAGRTTKEGLVCSYIHTGGRVGVLLELNCETDFVARTEDFQELAKNLSMQIAAASPQYVDSEEIPGDVIEKEKEIYRSRALEEGKPEKVLDRIVDGRLKKFYEEVCLLSQPYVRDTDISVKAHIDSIIAKTGEHIAVKRFTRYQLGESSSE